MINDFMRLHYLGWKPFYGQTLTLEEQEHYPVARVCEVERDVFLVHSHDQHWSARLPGRWYHNATDATDFPTVGDWIVLDSNTAQILRILPRYSLLQRSAAGQEDSGNAQAQLLCANIDNLLIVSPLDSLFNPRRIERYVTLARGAEVEPVVVLTKADLCAQPQEQIEALQQRLSLDAVVALNSLTDDARTILSPWLLPGATLALLGSSGAGKSTLTNNLAGTKLQSTQDVRSGDAKGRHTTTRRSLFALPGDICLIDTPGMRELRLAPSNDANDAVASSFSDIKVLAARCRFNDCSHQNEPGCAIIEALADGQLSPDRWNHYQRLLAEQETQTKLSAAVHERRAQQKAFGRMARNAQYKKQWQQRR